MAESKRERRASYEYTKSLNKPGRVGSFAEEERNRKADERQERKPKTERQDVRLPGAALLIVIGLFVLWIAATGNLKRIAQAWDFVRGKSESLPKSTSAVGASRGLTGITDFSNYHVESMLAQPTLSVTNVGGLT